jgi:hypothetical protein
MAAASKTVDFSLIAHCGAGVNGEKAKCFQAIIAASFRCFPDVSAAFPWFPKIFLGPARAKARPPPKRAEFRKILIVPNDAAGRCVCADILQPKVLPMRSMPCTENPTNKDSACILALKDSTHCRTIDWISRGKPCSSEFYPRSYPQ